MPASRYSLTLHLPSHDQYSVHNEPAQRYQAPAPVTSSYVPIGRPVINQSKPVAPPTPVGTSYASKQNELAEIRKTQEELAGRAATAPSTAGVAAVKTMTPPVARSPAPAAVPSPPVVPSTAPVSPPAPAPTPAKSSYERPEPVVSYGSSLYLQALHLLRLLPQGTSYTPVSLPKPGKLVNRWGANAVQQDSDTSAPKAPTPSWSRPTPTSTPSATAAASPLAPNTGAAQKPLTWSERQAIAKKQREEEEAASAAATSAQVGAPKLTTAGSGAAFGVGAGVGAAAGAGLARVAPRFDDDDDEGQKAPEWDDDDDEPASAPPPTPPAPPAPPAPPRSVVAEPEPVGRSVSFACFACN